ncbi:MAG TPA: hypothetical protein PKY82_17820 [Pyrinomonadaceae bacterium]|nr:hypothetical protein [Pyrinomonadaceae bacterium]
MKLIIVSLLIGCLSFAVCGFNWRPIAKQSKSLDLQTNQPKTARDFFNLLPQKYFTLEGCSPATDKNCVKARKEYIETFLEIEDTVNGYWKSGCDGAQSCLTMALFKRPNGTYIVAIQTEFEMGSDNYFLEYKGGKWFDLSTQVIPSFSKKNYYELPQKGTTIQVFKKKTVDTGMTEKGAKLYDLVWQNGKFTLKK